MKYHEFLKKFEGQKVMVLNTKGICTVWVNLNNKIIRETFAKGAEEMEIKKIYEDFIAFKINERIEGEWLILTFPLDRVIVNFSNLDLSK